MDELLPDRPPQNAVAPLITTANRALIAALMASVSAKGFENLTPAFAGVMPLLTAEGTRSTVLAQQAGVTKQAMSQLVRELEARGYVEQAPDSKDTRAKVIRLTKRGVALRQACLETSRKLQMLAEETLGKSELTRFQRNLSRLIEAFGRSDR